MISPRKYQVSIVLVLIYTCTAALAGGSNKGKTELKFQISSEETRWIRDNEQLCRGPVKPRYVAAVFISDDHYFSDLPDSEEVEKILKTSAAQSMSLQQQSFLTKSGALFKIDTGETVSNYTYYRLYAVSQDDAKKMAEALIEVLGNKRTTILIYRDLLHGLQEKLLVTEVLLRNHDVQAAADLADFRKAIKGAHYLSIDQAKEAVSELNKMLNNLDIEIAGMRAKQVAITKQKHMLKAKQKAIIDNKLQEDINSSERILLKLEEMSVDLLIEMETAEVRKMTASDLRKQAEDFFNQMNYKQIELQRSANRLEGNLHDLKRQICEIEEKLNTEILPPKVFQNKVTIYPVRTE